MHAEDLGHKYLCALTDELAALLSANDSLRALRDSAEVIAATPHEIDETLTANTNRIKRLTAQIAEVASHLSSVRVSDF